MPLPCNRSFDIVVRPTGKDDLEPVAEEAGRLLDAALDTLAAR